MATYHDTLIHQARSLKTVPSAVTALVRRFGGGWIGDGVRLLPNMRRLSLPMGATVPVRTTHDSPDILTD